MATSGDRLFENLSLGQAGNSLRKRRQFRPSWQRALAKVQPNPDTLAMKLDLKPFDFASAVARAGLATNGQPLKSTKAVEGAGFQQALSQALGSVSQTQNDASRMQREVQMDNPTVSLEETMVAMQKSQLGFQATLQVRNRLVQAYSDIMNMQV
jgi:flagellar hook-basal body complex protein FliE